MSISDGKEEVLALLKKKIQDVKKKTGRMARLMFVLFTIVFMFSSLFAQVNAASGKGVSTKVTLKIGKKSVTKKSYSLEKGKRISLKVSVRGLKGKKKISYLSSDKKIVTITSKGIIRARKAGSAKIKVTVRSGKKKLTTWTRIKVMKKTAAKSKQTDNNGNSEGSQKQSKILVAYFSCTGTTKPLAECAAGYLEADLFRIEALTPYTSADLNYGNDNSRATKEQNDPQARPAIAGTVNNMAQYDTVVLGYPIWWGAAPRIISTFLESYDFSGKTIVPFCTSHSSGIGSSAANLHSLVSSSVVWKEGRRFSAGTSKETVTQWLKNLGM